MCGFYSRVSYPFFSWFRWGCIWENMIENRKKNLSCVNAGAISSFWRNIVLVRKSTNVFIYICCYTQCCYAPISFCYDAYWLVVIRKVLCTTFVAGTRVEAGQKCRLLISLDVFISTFIHSMLVFFYCTNSDIIVGLSVLEKPYFETFATVNIVL